MLTLATTAPVDTAQYARNVREDTAELASYALSEHASSVHSGSPRPNSFVQPHIESYFPPVSERDPPTPQNLDDLRPPMIQEVSEPVTPEPGYPAPGTSIITKMIRKSPPSTSLRDNEDIKGAGPEPEDEDEDEEAATVQWRPMVTSNGVTVNYSERTPLLKKYSAESPHPDYIHGEHDIERQKLRRRGSWPKFRKFVSRSSEKGLSALRLLTNYKGWDRKAVWQKAVVAPSGYLPAVILGCLLNILDALSYGRDSSPTLLKVCRD
jgi:sulfate permease, SulP family